jgi:hypothetical protein
MRKCRNISSGIVGQFQHRSGHGYAHDILRLLRELITFLGRPGRSPGGRGRGHCLAACTLRCPCRSCPALRTLRSHPLNAWPESHAKMRKRANGPCAQA